MEILGDGCPSCHPINSVKALKRTQCTYLTPARQNYQHASTLNSSKIEFLLIGLRKQLDKIHNSSLNTTHSARNLRYIFDEHLTFSDQISAIYKACYYHIR